MNLSAILANFSFLILFISMLVYWIDSTTLVSYYPRSEEMDKTKEVRTHGIFEFNLLNFGNLGVVLSNISLFLLLCTRWVESGHFPLSNLYESLIFLSWALTSLHLIINSDSFLVFQNTQPSLFKIGLGSFPFPKGEGEAEENSANYSARKKIISKLVGSIIVPSALFTNAFASFSLPKDMQNSGPLVPALQSNWLMMHVTVMVLSYAALIIGSLLSIGFLVISVNQNQVENPLKPSFNSSNIVESNLDTRMPLNLPKILDNLSYRILGIGFPLLTIGILSGAVWANEAWGTYWSWDPKETWALLTWLVFAIYLHTRLNKGWEGKKPAIIASFGFLIVWVCFLGVNLLGDGLHSYGWLNTN